MLHIVCCRAAMARRVSSVHYGTSSLVVGAKILRWPGDRLLGCLSVWSTRHMHICLCHMDHMARSDGCGRGDVHGTEVCTRTAYGQWLIMKPRPFTCNSCHAASYSIHPVALPEWHSVVYHVPHESWTAALPLSLAAPRVWQPHM